MASPRFVPFLAAAFLFPMQAVASPLDDLAISVGTGPMPLDDLTLGLSGLGGRIMVPFGSVVPFVGLGHAGATTASWSEGDEEDRYQVSLAATSVSGGVRYSLTPDHKGVVPYGAACLNLMYGAIAAGQVDDQGTVDAFGAGALFGVGLDGFLTEHLSIGAEFGAQGAWWSGGSHDSDGDPGSFFGGTEFSIYTAAAVTVWR